MSERVQKMTETEIVQWQEELDKLEADCSTGKVSTPPEQKQKIDSLLARARTRKVNVKD